MMNLDDEYRMMMNIEKIQFPTNNWMSLNTTKLKAVVMKG